MTSDVWEPQQPTLLTRVCVLLGTPLRAPRPHESPVNCVSAFIIEGQAKNFRTFRFPGAGLLNVLLGADEAAEHGKRSGLPLIRGNWGQFAKACGAGQTVYMGELEETGPTCGGYAWQMPSGGVRSRI